MKSKTLQTAAVALVLAFFPSVASAGVMLTLQSDTADGSMVTVGDTIEFEVVLSGIDQSPTGDLLDLAAGVNFDPTIFSAPNANDIDAGDILPDTTATAFAKQSSPEHVQVSYTGFFNGLAIESNGLFFSFTAIVAAPGNVTVGFDGPATYAFDNSSPFGSPLSVPDQFDFRGSFVYTAVEDSTGVIPEPTSLACWSVLGLCVLGGNRRRVRRQLG